MKRGEDSLPYILICPLLLEERDQYIRLILNENSWKQVMDALENPPKPNAKLKRAAHRLRNIKT